jgi:foldase protein PrsA
MATLVAGIGLAGCGSSGAASGGTVARVGRAAITMTAVDHWVSVTSGGKSPTVSSSRYRTIRQQVLEFLISSEWLTEEAAERGLTPSTHELAAQLQKRKSTSFSGGEKEFAEFLKLTGQTLSDVMFEIRAELAAARIRRMLMGQERPVSHAEVTTYYNRNRQRFVIRERRALQITNRKSYGAAESLKRKIERSKDLGRLTTPEMVEHFIPVKGHHENALEKAAFSAKPNVLTGPVHLRVDYYLLEIRKITPASYRPLAQVASTIKKQLVDEQQHRTIAAFLRTWRRKWVAKTACESGAVAQQCRQARALAATRSQELFALG